MKIRRLTETPDETHWTLTFGLEYINIADDINILSHITTNAKTKSKVKGKEWKDQFENKRKEDRGYENDKEEL